MKAAVDRDVSGRNILKRSLLLSFTLCQFVFVLPLHVERKADLIQRPKEDDRLGPAQPLADDAVLNNLLSWLVENGAEKVASSDALMEIVATPLKSNSVHQEGKSSEKEVARAEYGVRAMRAFAEDDVVTALPPGLWISNVDPFAKKEDEVEGTTEHGSSRVEKSGGRRSPTVPTPVPGAEKDFDLALVIFVLQELAKGNASFWAPYFAIFPQEVPHMPLFFTAKEILEIQYRPALQNMRIHMEYVNNAFLYCKERGLLPAGLDSSSLFRTVSSVVWSRTFSVEIENHEKSEISTADEGTVDDEEIGEWADDVAEDPAEVPPASTDVVPVESLGVEDWTDEILDGDPTAFKDFENGIYWGLSVDDDHLISPKLGGRPPPSVMVGGESETDMAYMMLPFFDMLNHNFANEVMWEMRGGKMILWGQKGAKLGQPLYTTYGQRGNDDYFLTYGFVPSYNPYDDARIFSSAEAVVQFYKDLYVEMLPKPTDDPLMAPIRDGFDAAAALQVATQAMDSLDAFDEAWAPHDDREVGGDAEREWTVFDDLAMGTTWDNGPEYENDRSAGFLAWLRKHVDPRLIAILAAIRYSHVARSGAVLDKDHLLGSSPETDTETVMPPLTWIDNNDISIGSLRIGRDFKGLNKCQDQAENIVPYLRFAAQAIRRRVLMILASYATTIDEDKALLDCHVAAEASANGDAGGADEAKNTCPWSGSFKDGRLSGNMQNIINYRLNKKILLAEVAERLAEACPLEKNVEVA